MKKTLHLKMALRAALLVLLLSVVGMVEGYAYDFVVEGIRYEITSTATNTVGVTGQIHIFTMWLFQKQLFMMV